jgi:hypothetical protein
VAERLGAGVYFNTLVPLGGRLAKYGIMSTRRLLSDLRTWGDLYVGEQPSVSFSVAEPGVSTCSLGCFAATHARENWHPAINS